MTYSISDPYLERTDGQAVVLRLLDVADDLIDPASISAVRATLESLDTGEVLFLHVDCTPGSGGRGSVNADDELVITFTAADMASSGLRERQGRRLSYRVTHSGGRVLHGDETFVLLNFASVPLVTS